MPAIEGKPRACTVGRVGLLTPRPGFLLSYTCSMDNERVREFCLSLPHVVEALKWRHYLAYWIGDRAIGGKMFAMADLDGAGSGVFSFHCGAERFHEMLEHEGICPAPYMLNHGWVALERWSALRPREIEDELLRAHALIFAKLPSRTRAVLELPEKQRARFIRERKKELAAQGKTRG